MPLQKDLGENLARHVLTVATVAHLHGLTGDDHVLDILEGNVTAAGAVIQATVGIASDLDLGLGVHRDRFQGLSPISVALAQFLTRAF